VTFENVGLVVGMRRFSGFRAWICAVLSAAVMLAAGTLARSFAVSHDFGVTAIHILMVIVIVSVGLLLAVPLISYALSVSYLGGLCALGLAVAASLIMGKVATESVNSYRAASSGELRVEHVEAKGLW
jgi:hypothetical protein